jgi:hypothetical protein
MADQRRFHLALSTMPVAVAHLHRDASRFASMEANSERAEMYRDCDLISLLLLKCLAASKYNVIIHH